jgi:DNA-binding response OmpR family regulator
VLEAEDGERALDMVRKERPDLVVLDVMLPGADGLEICRMLRSQSPAARIPIVMLTAKAGEVDRILGLEIGADDYVSNSPRANARARRAAPPNHRARTAEGDLRTGRSDQFRHHEAWLDGKTLELSLREFELLKFFVRNPYRVYDRLTILDLVWGNDTYVEPRTVDVHVRRLRLLVERDPARPELIHTVRGVGYKFNDHALDG